MQLTSPLRLDPLPELVENDAVEERERFDDLAVAQVKEPGVGVGVGLAIARRSANGGAKKITSAVWCHMANRDYRRTFRKLRQCVL
jgi:hypothetical protein